MPASQLSQRSGSVQSQKPKKPVTMFRRLGGVYVPAPHLDQNDSKSMRSVTDQSIDSSIYNESHRSSSDQHTNHDRASVNQQNQYINQQQQPELTVKTNGSLIRQHDIVDQQHSLTSSDPTSGTDPSNSSPSGDSGFSDASLAMDKQWCTDKHARLCKQLTDMTQLTLQFLHDVQNDEEYKARDLLDELETKLGAALIDYDVSLAKAERQLRATLDRSRIGEERVNWLLVFNRCQLDFRQVFTVLSNEIFPNLEQVLRLRDRGCKGLAPAPQTQSQLERMLDKMYDNTDIIGRVQ